MTVNTPTRPSRMLFFDDEHIETMTNVGRVVHPGTPVINPHTGTRALLTPGTLPWEPSRNLLYGTVLDDPDDRVLKMWYLTLLPSGDRAVCYATSTDGLGWDKSPIGACEFDGSTNNNLVYHTDIPSVIKDNADGDPARRYKMMSHNLPEARGYCVSYSPDGFHWTPQSDGPALPHGDVCVANPDEISGGFLATVKFPHATRAAFASTSKDFSEWSSPRLTLAADQRDDDQARARGALQAEIYGMPIVSYQGVYVGLPWIFEVTALTGGPRSGSNDGTMHVQAAFSRDLVDWSREDRTPLIAPGVAGSFDAGMILGTANTFIVRDQRIWLYYSGFNTTHGAPMDQKAVAIGAVTWRIDGFASLVNGGDIPGTVITKPVTVTRKNLRVNADLTAPAAVGGSLRVEVLDASSFAPIPGYSCDDALPLSGDHLDSVAAWRGTLADLSELSGQSVRFRFHLRHGRLYSCGFSND